MEEALTDFRGGLVFDANRACGMGLVRGLGDWISGVG